MTPPKPTSPLAVRIAHDIKEQLERDGEIWEEWMADWIDQEVIIPMAEVLDLVAKETEEYSNEHDGQYALRPETCAKVTSALLSARMVQS